MARRFQTWSPWPVLALLPVLFLAGCGDDKSVTVPPVVTFLAEGWGLFEEGEYEEAIAKFEAAVNADAGLGDGHNGLGWCYFRLDSIEPALDRFDLAVAKGFVGAGAQAGRCLILNRMDEYRQAIFAGGEVIETDDRFELEGDITLDIRDVRLAMAQSYFALGEYEEALDQITIVDSTIRINPNSALFVRELLTAIEDLTEDLSVF